MVELPAEEITILSRIAIALGYPALNPDIADLVTTHARDLGGTRARSDRTELVSLIARLAGLLDLTSTADTRMLVTRLSANPPGMDLALTDEEEQAYVRTADRMNRMWAHGSGIDCCLY